MRVKIISLLIGTFFIIFSANVSIAKSVTSSKVTEFRDHGEIDKIKCDKVISDTLRVGESCTFYVDFTANAAEAKISDINYWFWSDKDYNGNDDIFTIHPTKEIINSDWIVKNKKVRLVESSGYKINSLPDTNSKENIIFKAEVLFNEVLPDGSLSSKQERLVQCIFAKVSK